ncbi:hypothetical protein [Veillonella agrestimuris]|uniref:hypothetical protein n=1 Tax=Veillonella agrestimuris TaxID=2941340 RepID=UPI0020409656|nr:hypothetical protein [Veillonella agrestimuris]
MVKRINTHGGGAQTNINGLQFEQTTSLQDALELAGYTVDSTKILKDGIEIGLSVPKRKLYTDFLELKENNIDYAKYNSKRWEPDECFINFNNKHIYIIEKKFQNSSGSVDEKLPSCHFKLLEYSKLFSELEYFVVYLYVLNDWFKQKQYSDTLTYIEQMGCHYFYNEIPLDFLGL